MTDRRALLAATWGADRPPPPTCRTCAHWHTDHHHTLGACTTHTRHVAETSTRPPSPVLLTTHNQTCGHHTPRS